jgi:hypothetical protein
MNKQVSNLLLFAALIFGLFLIFHVISGFTVEKFQPEFLDTRQIAKTIAVEDSSYMQTTNHMVPARYDMGPIEGVPSQWQVNQYKSYIK